MSVSISEIIAGASAHAVPLAGECAGYLVLAAADQAVAAPRRIGPEEVRLFDDGTVRVEGARAAAESDSEGDLRALLDALLVRASSATPALLRASRRTPGRGIAALVREIETALIPVNRSAAHRALARLERETTRARHAGRLAVTAAVTAAKEVVRAEPPAVKVAEPLPPAVEVLPEPRAESFLADLADEIPSLFAPPVASIETIAALAAEIETRPEPIVARRSAPPPARTPSPPPLPSARRNSPPPLPVAEAQRTTPVFGTVIESYADDEMDIEVVFDDELMGDELADDELTGVLVRSEPLEVSAMFEEPASPDPTDPCPPALDDEPADAASDEGSGAASDDAPVEFSGPDATVLLAEAAQVPPVEIASDAIAAEAPSEASEPSEPNEAFAAEALSEASEPNEPNEAFAAEAPSEASEPNEPNEAFAAEASSEPSEPNEAFAAEPPSEPNETFAAEAPTEPNESNEAFWAEAPSEPNEPNDVFSAEAPSESNEAFAAETPGEPIPTEPLELHGETLALALAIAPAVMERAPVPHIPLPKPRPSDVDDLLDRMAQANADDSDELRSSLKHLAGLEPTPPPPES